MFIANRVLSRTLIAGAFFASLSFPSVGAGLGVGASVGGASVGAGASVGGGNGVSAGAGASLGGSGGVNAGAGASVGGNDGVNAGVGVSVGDGADVGVGVGIGGGTNPAGPDAPGSPSNPGMAAIVADMSASELQQNKKRCKQVLTNQGRFDRDIVALCKLVQTASR